MALSYGICEYSREDSERLIEAATKESRAAVLDSIRPEMRKRLSRIFQKEHLPMLDFFRFASHHMKEGDLNEEEEHILQYADEINELLFNTILDNDNVAYYCHTHKDDNGDVDQENLSIWEDVQSTWERLDTWLSYREHFRALVTGQLNLYPFPYPFLAFCKFYDIPADILRMLLTMPVQELKKISRGKLNFIAKIPLEKLELFVTPNAEQKYPLSELTLTQLRKICKKNPEAIKKDYGKS